ncbi:MAG: hypothetical protein IH588_19185 [Anaerolineales bacterium]|nr:hypothetical protein [Anaerolineales bacterium]
MHLTLGMASANALALGDVRWKLTRPICGNLKQFPTPYHFSGWTASPSPPQRRYPLTGTVAQTVGRLQQRNYRDNMHFLNNKQYEIKSSIHIKASSESVWRNIIEINIETFKHPTYFFLLGIPKPLKAKINMYGIGGTRIAYFSNGNSFSQKIIKWKPYEQCTFTFEASAGFRVAYLLDLSNGPFQMRTGTYDIIPEIETDGVVLYLSNLYELDGIIGKLLYIPVRIILLLFQKNLLYGIKINTEKKSS